jgi:hypothetical protein
MTPEPGLDAHLSRPAQPYHVAVDEERLTRLRQLADMATAEPWVSYVEGRDISSGDSFIRTADAGEASDIYLSTGGAYANHAADQDFISAARLAIPELIAEIRRLRR